MVVAKSVNLYNSSLTGYSDFLWQRETQNSLKANEKKQMVIETINEDE